MMRPASRAQRRPYGYFFLTRRRACQQHVRDIRAGDQQDKDHGPKQHKQRSLDRDPQLFL